MSAEPASDGDKNLLQRLWGTISENSIPDTTPDDTEEPAVGQQTQHWTPRLQAQLTQFWKVEPRVTSHLTQLVDHISHLS